jgi:glycosyltransferase involved in cell wall biosynthesis
LIKIFHLTNTYSGKTETFIRGFLFSLNAREDIVLFCQQLSSLIDPDIIYDDNVRVESISFFNFLNIKLFRFSYFISYLFKSKGINTTEFKSADAITVDFTSNLKWLLSANVRLDKPIFVFVHGYDLSKVFRKSDFVDWFHSIAKVNNIYFIVPCLYFLNKLVVEFGIPSKRILHLPYGFNKSFLTKLEINPSDLNTQDYFNLLFVGRLVQKKQPLALVEMMNVLINHKKMINVKLKIIGEGPLDKSILARINTYKLNHCIELMGFKKHDIVINEISNCDIYVQHSITDFEGDQEGLPNAILEALSFNKPVISTIHSGIPDVIKHSVNGFLVNEYDYKNMANYIELIYSNRYDLDNVLSVKSNVLKPWSNEERVTKFIDFIKMVNV